MVCPGTFRIGSLSKGKISRVARGMSTPWRLQNRAGEFPLRRLLSTGPSPPETPVHEQVALLTRHASEPAGRLMLAEHPPRSSFVQAGTIPAGPMPSMPRLSPESSASPGAGTFVARHPDRGLARSAADDRDPVLDSGPCRKGSRDSECSQMDSTGMDVHAPQPDRAPHEDRLWEATATSTRSIRSLPMRGSSSRRVASRTRWKRFSMLGTLDTGLAAARGWRVRVPGRRADIADMRSRAPARDRPSCTGRLPVHPRREAHTAEVHAGSLRVEFSETRIERAALREAVVDPLSHGWLLLFAD